MKNAHGVGGPHNFGGAPHGFGMPGMMRPGGQPQMTEEQKKESEPAKIDMTAGQVEAAKKIEVVKKKKPKRKGFEDKSGNQSETKEYIPPKKVNPPPNTSISQGNINKPSENNIKKEETKTEKIIENKPISSLKPVSSNISKFESKISSSSNISNSSNVSNSSSISSNAFGVRLKKFEGDKPKENTSNKTETKSTSGKGVSFNTSNNPIKKNESAPVKKNESAPVNLSNVKLKKIDNKEEPVNKKESAPQGEKKNPFGVTLKKVKPKEYEPKRENPFYDNLKMFQGKKDEFSIDDYQRQRRNETVYIKNPFSRKPVAPNTPIEEMDLDQLETEFTRIVPTHRYLKQSDINQKVSGLNCDYKKNFAYIQLLLDYNIFDFTCKNNLN